MTLPSDFLFSQGNLQDFEDCHRRFELKHQLRLAWPALEVEPALENERRLQRGEQFHRMVRQYLVGIDPAQLARTTHDADIVQWWDNFRQHAPTDIPGNHYAEVSLVGELEGFRLAARYDLITAQPGHKFSIIDWKTARGRPKRSVYGVRLQTRVYPFLLVLVGSSLNHGNPILPDQIEMIYWFSESPDQPLVFPYSEGQFQADAAYLAALITDIKSRQQGEFELTADTDRCQFCVYRSLCDRGGRAGSLDQREADFEEEGDTLLAIDFDQISEIEF